jgi:hypothetical protein
VHSGVHGDAVQTLLQFSFVHAIELGTVHGAGG